MAQSTVERFPTHLYKKKYLLKHAFLGCFCKKLSSVLIWF